MAVEKILNYNEERNMNAFQPGRQKLRNLVTEEIVDREAAKRLLEIFETGLNLYTNFRNERIVERSKPLSATIKKRNLPTFKTLFSSEKINREKNKNKN